jgi:PAS domain S-box-containing protein
LLDHRMKRIRSHRGGVEVDVTKKGTKSSTSVVRGRGSQALPSGAHPTLGHNTRMSLRPEETASRLAAIVASSDDAIVSKDLNGVIKSWNAAAERMFGWTAEEAIGKPITIIIPKERMQEEDYVLSQIRQGLVVDHFETVRQRKDGTTLQISVTISPIHGPEGTVIGASKIARDISEQIRLRQEADEANRLKDEFLATLSHELRTPLNTVVGYTAMLRKGMMDPTQKEKAIDVIHRNAQVLTDLVGDLLDTSRMVTGKVRLEMRETDLSLLATEAVENIRPSISAKGLGLDVQIQPGIRIMADGDRLRQVLWNLLTNAVKFTPSGERIEVQVYTESPSVHIVVRDTGIGMSSQALPHIFKRFWQGETGQMRDFGGLGLGLSLSKYLTELHGGSIQATSPGHGKGSEFRISLPFKTAGVARAV